uniref:7TM_GPCR_Srx domain-containing protein n=1 Tax=Parastrongyloides trichosuri TaxID=131310 RepID=A0A0N5A1S4_PARTI
MIISDFLKCITQATVVIPLSFFGDSYFQGYKESFIFRILCEMDTFGYQVGINLLLSFTIIKTMLIFFPKKFEKIYIHILIVISWLYGVFVILLHLYLQVHKTYSSTKLSLHFIYLNGIDNTIKWLNYTLIINDNIPLLIFAMYLALFIKFRYKNNKMLSKRINLVRSSTWFQHNNKVNCENSSKALKTQLTYEMIIKHQNIYFQLRILFQGFILAFVQVLETMGQLHGLKIQEAVGNDKAIYWLIFLNCFTIFHNCFSGISLFLCITPARTFLKKFFNKFF